MKIVSLVAASLAITLACTLVTSSPLLQRSANTSEPFFTISGTLNPVSETTIPGNTRVLVLWTVLSSEPEYLYVFGEGTLDFQNYTFVIHFDGPPPNEVMNQIEDLSLGYGRVILTSNQKWHGQIFQDSFSRDEILGIAASDLILFIDGNVDSVPNVDWLKNVGQGFSVIREIKASSGSETFELVDPASMHIIIDDLDNIEIADWW